MERKREEIQKQSDVVKSKKENLKFLKENGIEVYKYSYKYKEDIINIREKYKNIEEGVESQEKLKTAGRIMNIRLHGKTAFLNIKDNTDKIQLYIKKDIIGEETFKWFKKLDIGDIIGVEGPVFKTKTKELTIKVEKIDLLTKSLLPLPEKWHGLKDKELRYRKRYLDLIVNDDVKKTFFTRIKIINEIRKFLNKKGFVEVETPMLHPIPGGAKARPFITHHNALDMDLYLRIAPELYLKRLLVGGFEKVYEINRNFRNEGISIKHNPEFTMLEAYQAYVDYKEVMQLTKDLIIHISKILEKEKCVYNDVEIDFSADKWKELSMVEAIKEYAGIDIHNEKKEKIIKMIKEKNDKLDLQDDITKGELIALFFEEFVEEKIRKENFPIFITDFPVEVSPLSKVKRDNPDFTERFELYIYGTEIANGFSELNNPDEQEKRFKEQIEMDTEGEVSKTIDYDYIEALQYGMPPAGGVGIGIDRLTMIFTNSLSIRDVILFPLLKPEKKGEQ